MGWGNCGLDSKGRPIGYVFAAICDHPGCTAKIDRGLSYVCGQMHGEDEYSCEKYFCPQHKTKYVEMCDKDTTTVCDECAKTLLENEDWYEDEEEGVIKEKGPDYPEYVRRNELVPIRMRHKKPFLGLVHNANLAQLRAAISTALCNDNEDD